MWKNPCEITNHRKRKFNIFVATPPKPTAASLSRASINMGKSMTTYPSVLDQPRVAIAINKTIRPAAIHRCSF